MMTTETTDISDLDRIVEIAAAQTDSWSREQIEEEFGYDFAKVLVVRHNGVIIGWCDIHITYDNAHLNEIAVDEEYRRIGAGRLLLGYAAKLSAERGCESMTLEVRESNMPAIGLYRSFGFETAGKRKRFYTNPEEDALVMKLEISEGKI